MISDSPKKPVLKIETEPGEKSLWLSAARAVGLDFARWVRTKLNEAAKKDCEAKTEN